MAGDRLYPRTLRALLRPRRLLPAAGVTAAMVATELVYTGSGAAIAVDLLLCSIFWFHAPFTWRRLCSPRETGSRQARAIGYVVYLLSSGLVVGALGLFLPAMGRVPWTYMTDLRSLGVVLVLYLVGGWGLGRDIDLEEGLVAEKRRAEALARAAEQAQLLAVRSHLDPHFLFNTLNAIAEWCTEDPRTAEAATLALATMLRQILSGVRAETWPLARELELLELLFDLYRVRDPERYRFHLQLPDPVPELELPPLILLPLAENAVKHGPSAGYDGPIELRVEVEDEAKGERTLRVELTNPGSFAGRREGGMGVEMVERRLALAYGEQAALSLEGRGDRTVARVTIRGGWRRDERR